MQVVEEPSDLQQAGANVILRFAIGKDRLLVQTMRCSSCGHFFVNPTFDDNELDRLYSSRFASDLKKEYRLVESVSGLTWAEHHGCQESPGLVSLTEATSTRAKRLRSLVEQVGNHSLVGKILDYGARSGQVTSLFPEATRYVYDRDSSGRPNDEVLVLDTHSEIAIQAPYDLIVLTHVLEHVTHPCALLVFLRSVLAKHGLLYIEVPIEYCGSWLRRRGVPLGAHINLFTIKSLLCCAGCAGLADVKYVGRELAFYGELLLPVYKLLIGQGRASSRPWLLPGNLGFILDSSMVCLSRFPRGWRPLLESIGLYPA